ncbi:hypothetical protein HTZ84_21200 [Haloterrigena sp. SYSU A558-1]|uniref:Uncharacterized protein n=1 Tax=Haloterrigena gelatinilytica TaxID=2741724 RepID=A0ABX2LIT1_9EURY|nr:hypothetical protein [Haloterrigena gelatinilytica]NUC74783.1 hypothetical protein [Haloterrigena gelatinilytica]
MNTQRLSSEISALEKRYTVAWNDTMHGVELRDWRYPDGWTLQNREKWRQKSDTPPGPAYVAPLLVRIPKTYPHGQPYACLPRGLHYTKDRVEHVIDPKEATEQGEIPFSMADWPDNDWLLWCVHDLDWEPNSPEYTLPKFLQWMMASFSYPDKDRPLRYARTHG